MLCKEKILMCIYVAMLLSAIGAHPFPDSMGPG